MVEKCSICGNKLEEDVKFCPDCGEKIAPAKETKKTKKVETKVKDKTKTTTKKKKNKIKFSIPKISIKNIPKPVLTGIVLICVALIAVADKLRRDIVGNIGTFVVNKNINFTNICTTKCSF